MQYHSVSADICNIVVRSYKRVSEGNPPVAGPAGKDFDKVDSICDAICCVCEVPDVTTLVRCKANPYNLGCECKGGRKTGMCAHILAVTHTILKAQPVEEQKKLSYCNIKLMGKALTDKSKARGKWLKGKNAAKDLHYLHKDSSDGSSDESADDW